MSGLHAGQYTDESLLQGIRIAKQGGRVNIDEGTTEEQRLLRLIRVVENQAYSAGQLGVRNQMLAALGLIPGGVNGR